MSNIDSSKNLAGIGTILLALGSFVPVIGIIGIIMLLIGIKGLADAYNDRGIYQNALWGVIFGIIGLVAVAFVVVGLIWGSVFSGAAFATSPDAGLGVFAAGIILIIAAVVVLFIFYLLAALYFRKAFSALAQKSGEHMFETAGLLLFIGAILTIVVIGLVLVFIAWILAAVAFFSIKTQPTQPYTYTPPPTASPPPAASATRFCPNCGAPVSANATFCPNCGKPLA